MTPRRVPLDPGFLRPVAHRGLHDTNRGIVENTSPAFAAAIAAGYGIECDLRPAAGGLPLVFHDATLDRLVDGRGDVAALTPAALVDLRYRVCGTSILTFEAFLGLVDGAVPLLVEVKSEWAPPDTDFLRAVAGSANTYGGPLALMSFDPDVVAALARLAPDVPRGLVSGSYRTTAGDGWWDGLLDAGRQAQLRDLADLERTGASFAAYEVAALPAPATLSLRTRGLPLFAWTVRSHSDRAIATAHADVMIFEGFRPKACNVRPISPLSPCRRDRSRP